MVGLPVGLAIAVAVAVALIVTYLICYGWPYKGRHSSLKALKRIAAITAREPVANTDGTYSWELFNGQGWLWLVDSEGRYPGIELIITKGPSLWSIESFRIWKWAWRRPFRNDPSAQRLIGKVHQMAVPVTVFVDSEVFAQAVKRDSIDQLLRYLEQIQQDRQLAPQL